jgi:hypothetical protein
MMTIAATIDDLTAKAGTKVAAELRAALDELTNDVGGQ